MAVYVDDAKNPYGRMIMCHMIADTLDELHLMANKLGLKYSYFQNKSNHPHYDLSLTKRTKAVNLGAIEVTQKELVLILKKKGGEKNVNTQKEQSEKEIE